MGLSSSLWSSVSGLLTHGEKMNVIGNNIANVNTIGFKGQRMDFQDFIYQDSYSAAGPTQIGRGVSVNAVLGDFSQGSFETTNDPMDMAIGGKGYFQVSDPYSDQVWYTRAGNFRFNKEGALCNPQGLILQGWKIDNSSGPTIATGATPVVTSKSAIQGSGVPMDIVLDTWTVPPKQTTKLQYTLNLSADGGNDRTPSITNPFFAMSSAWNGSKANIAAGHPPISSDAFAYQTSTKIFDEGGSAHTVTTYFDQIAPTAVANLPSGYKMYEYLVTMNPSEDLRTYGGKYDPTTKTLVDDPATNCAGIPASGTPAPTGNAYTAAASGDYTAALAAVNTALGLAGASALTSVGVLKLPSGAWVLDPNDPAVAAALNASPTPLNPNWATMNPAPTGDPLDINKVKNFSDSNAAGILMRGTITFNASGQVVNQTAYTYMGNTVPPANATPPPPNANVVFNNDPNNMANWQPTAVSNNGLPVFTPNFTGQPMANSVRQTSDGTIPSASSYLVEFDMGFKCIGNLNDPWGVGGPVLYPGLTKQNVASTQGYYKPNPVAGGAPILVTPDYTSLANMKDGQKEPSSTTSLSGSSVTRYNYQNGYTSGDLTNTSVDQNGVIYGVYSNGVTMPLYQITLYNFVDPQGLRREGGNLFGATMESGNPQVGPANQNGMGSVNSFSIEQSNVDMAREFVQMITTQRGFQANSKGVTTVDQMLETVIGMKR